MFIERDILDYINPASKIFQRKHERFSLLFIILFWCTSATFFRRLIIISWWVKGRESSFWDTPPPSSSISSGLSCPHRLCCLTFGHLAISLHSSFLPFFFVYFGSEAPEVSPPQNTPSVLRRPPLPSSAGVRREGNPVNGALSYVMRSSGD